MVTARWPPGMRAEDEAAEEDDRDDEDDASDDADPSGDRGEPRTARLALDVGGLWRRRRWWLPRAPLAGSGVDVGSLISQSMQTFVMRLS